MWPESFNIPISHEVQEKLEIYRMLLLKWQRAINLVSPYTMEDAWVRHFADSAQLLDLIEGGKKTLVDLGSGAGFPGLVLGILRPELEIHLIESDERKCQFLKTVSRETGVQVFVHSARIAEVVQVLSPDVVTARALAELKTLLDYVSVWAAASPDLACVFLKGERAASEIEKARDFYSFVLEVFPSKTAPKAEILRLKNIVPVCV